MSHRREYVDVGSLELLMPCGETPISHGQLRLNSFYFDINSTVSFPPVLDFIFLPGHGMLLTRCGVAEIVFAQLLI